MPHLQRMDPPDANSSLDHSTAATAYGSLRLGLFVSYQMGVLNRKTFRISRSKNFQERARHG